MSIFVWILIAVLLVVVLGLLYRIVTGKLKIQWTHDEDEHTHQEDGD